MGTKFKFLIKNIGILTIGNFSTKILIFLLVPLYTNVLTTDEYGLYDLIITTIQLLYPILTVNVAAAILRFTMDPNVSQEGILSISTKYFLLSSVGVVILLCIIHIFHLIPKIAGFEFIILGYYICYVLNQCLISYAKGLEQIKAVAFAGIISSVVTLGINLLFLLVLHMGLKGFFIANFLGQFVPVLYYMYRLQPCGHLKLLLIKGSGLEKEMLAYSIPLIIVEVGWWINNASDRYVVATICGTSAVGLLSVSYKIPSIINVVQTIFIQAWHISGIKEYEEGGDSDFFRTVFTCLNMIMTFCCAGLIFFSRLLGKILFAKEFFIAWQYTPFLLISSVINASSGFFGSILAAKKDSKNMAYSSILGAVVNIFLNIILVYLTGIQGAAIATVISSVIIFTVRWRNAIDVLNLKDISTIMFSWVILCMQSVVMIFGIMWFQTIPIIILLWVYRSQMKQFAIRLYGYIAKWKRK